MGRKLARSDGEGAWRAAIVEYLIGPQLLEYLTELVVFTASSISSLELHFPAKKRYGWSVPIIVSPFRGQGRPWRRAIAVSPAS